MNRRGFILLSEYVSRHPDVSPDIFSEPPFGHLWLVRHLQYLVKLYNTHISVV